MLKKKMALGKVDSDIEEDNDAGANPSANSKGGKITGKNSLKKTWAYEKLNPDNPENWESEVSSSRKHPYRVLGLIRIEANIILYWYVYCYGE
jgi:hypothetical protein